MICSKCGKQNDDGVAFCTECGNPLTPANSQPVEQQVQNPQPNGNMDDGKGLSIAALVLGIISIVFLWFFSVFSLIFVATGIVGIILGYKGRKKSIACYGKASGMATAGFVLSIIATALSALYVISCVACVGCIAGSVPGALEGLEELEDLNY